MVTIVVAGLGLDLRPRRVGPLREPDVVGPVVGQADDPAVVLGRAVVVAELELLEAEDAVTQPAAQPVRGPRSDPAEPDDDRVPLRPHGLSLVAVRPPIDQLDESADLDHPIGLGPDDDLGADALPDRERPPQLAAEHDRREAGRLVLEDPEVGREAARRSSPAASSIQAQTYLPGSPSRAGVLPSTASGDAS